MSVRWPTWAGRRALKRDPGLANGLNVHAGEITHDVVARALGLKARPAAAA
jgi:alanine dehydrogenase